MACPVRIVNCVHVVQHLYNTDPENLVRWQCNICGNYFWRYSNQHMIILQIKYMCRYMVKTHYQHAEPAKESPRKKEPRMDDMKQKFWKEKRNFISHGRK